MNSPKKKKYLEEYRKSPLNKLKHRETVRKYRNRKAGLPEDYKPTPRPILSLEDKRRISREYARVRRLSVLNHYGAKCVCCGEDEIKFLAVDHKDGGGNKHRKEIGIKTDICSWIIRNDYPELFQILCHNCNQAKGYYGACPHSVLTPPD